jgi:hypothetical protein
MQMLTWNSRNKDMDNITNILTTPSPSSQRRQPEKNMLALKPRAIKKTTKPKRTIPTTYMNQEK